MLLICASVPSGMLAMAQADTGTPGPEQTPQAVSLAAAPADGGVRVASGDLDFGSGDTLIGYYYM